MSAKEEDEESVYENTNGMPMAGGRNLHMEVNIFLLFFIFYYLFHTVS
jgi:hypothetical protein